MLTLTSVGVRCAAKNGPLQGVRTKALDHAMSAHYLDQERARLVAAIEHATWHGPAGIPWFHWGAICAEHNNFSRLPWDELSLWKSMPSGVAPSVYFLFHGQEVVYVGKSHDDLCSRWQSHIDGGKFFLMEFWCWKASGIGAIHIRDSP